MNPYFTTIQCRKLRANIEELELNRTPVCLAPLTTMSFGATGHVYACCANTQYAFGKYPEQSLRDIWFGESRTKLIDAINRYNFDMGCQACYKQICIQNRCCLPRVFDVVAPSSDRNDNGYPANFEFECSNICNYECIMCGGKWSSSIRKNREKLPPIPTPHDDAFIDQLDEFIPHLKRIYFSGGESFLTPLYYKIWEKLAEMQRTDLPCLVLSNGSTYNEKVERILDILPRMTVTMSIDSLQKNTYEFIRKNGNFDTVFKNIQILLHKKRLVWFNFCAMKYNIYEFPDIVRFCENNSLGLTLCFVYGPMGNKLKGIHVGGTNKQVFEGDGQEGMTLSPACTRRKPFIDDFCLSSLHTDELRKICMMLDKTLDWCGDRYKDVVTALHHNIRTLIQGKIE